MKKVKVVSLFDGHLTVWRKDRKDSFALSKVNDERVFESAAEFRMFEKSIKAYVASNKVKVVDSEEAKPNLKEKPVAKDEARAKKERAEALEAQAEAEKEDAEADRAEELVATKKEYNEYVRQYKKANKETKKEMKAKLEELKNKIAKLEG